MLIYDTINTNLDEENTFDLSVPCEWGHYKLYKNAGIVRIVHSKPRLWLIEIEQITAKPFAWMLMYDTVTTNLDEENTLDLSVPCEWGHYKLYKKTWIVWIGLSKPRLWLIELEQITAKPFAWMLIYDTITTKLDEENTFDLSVPCEWGHYKLYKNAGIVNNVDSKPRLWLIEIEQITAKPFAWMLMYDTVTTNLDEENILDLSVPCEWGHYKLYKNAWIVWIGPSKPRLWLIELEQITRTQPNCKDVNLWYNFDEENTFDLSVPCEWGQYKLYKNAWIVWIVPSKPRLWLIELEQITAKPFAWMLNYHAITTNLDEENTFDLNVPCECGHYKQ